MAEDMRTQFALDIQGLDRLRQRAAQDPGAAAGAAAEQFEALLLQMMIKSMREAIPESGLLDSQQSRFYHDLMDRQWAQELSGRGIGLADQLTRQLEKL